MRCILCILNGRCCCGMCGSELLRNGARRLPIAAETCRDFGQLVAHLPQKYKSLKGKEPASMAMYARRKQTYEKSFWGRPLLLQDNQKWPHSRPFVHFSFLSKRRCAAR